MVGEGASPDPASDVLDAVLEVEQRAAASVADARAAARERRAATEEAYKNTVREAREEAQRLIQDAVDDAHARADREYAAALAGAEQERTKLLERHHDALDSLVAEVVDLVVTPSHRRATTDGG